MSRMHSTKRGKSGSKRPLRTAPPEWSDYSPEDLENLIVQLAKKGENASRIGVILRDQYGVPLVKLVNKKSITKILEEKGIKSELPEELLALIKMAVSLDRHQIANPKDMCAKRGIQLVESKIKRLAKYYKREGKLPKDWQYDLKQAQLLVK